MDFPVCVKQACEAVGVTPVSLLRVNRAILPVKVLQSPSNLNLRLAIAGAWP
jgi:hypothetical protein